MLQSWDDLIKPTQFDWAEDVEEGLEGDPEDLLRPSQFDWADEVEDALEASSYIERELDGVEETEGIIMGGKIKKALTSSTKYKDTQAHTNTSSHEYDYRYTPSGPRGTPWSSNCQWHC